MKSRIRLKKQVSAIGVFLWTLVSARAFLGIPGNIASENGFDSGGDGEVCWLTRSTNAYSDVLTSILGNVQPINNPLMSNFSTVGDIELYPTCPEGTSLQVFLPPSLGENAAVTQYNYSFTVNGTLDLCSEQWPSDLIVSDDSNAIEAAIHIMLCKLQTTGFCSPFVHYQTNDTNSQDVKFGDLHGGTHIDSEFVTISVVPDALFEFEVQVPVRVNEPGIFSVVAGLVFFLSDVPSFPDPLYMASVAAISDNTTEQVLEFRNEPEILTTSTAAEIASYVIIGLGGMVLLFLMFQLIQHRKDQVVTLTQGKFLVAMCFFGVIAMAGSIFFNPKSDLYCNMLGPMLVIPIHIFYSIILGRLWRINAVISPLLLLTLDKEQSFSTRCVEWLGRMTTCRRQQKLRRKVTDAQLARVIALWASPQIILQVCSWLLDPDEVGVVFNEDLTKGSKVCSGMYGYGVPEVLSAVLLIVQFVAMWVLARQSQDLPSLFNEATVIFDVTLVSVIILALATIVIIMCTGPSTSPTVSYIIGVLGTQAMILNASIKLILPKLRMVWRGETVVVTKLITDHQREQRKKSSIIIAYNEDDLPVDPKTVPKTDTDDSSDSSSVVLVHTTVDESIGLSELEGEEDDDDFRRNISHHSTGGLSPIAEAFDSINSIAFDLSKVRANGELPRTDINSTEFRSGDSKMSDKPSKRPTLLASPHSVHNFTRSKRTIVADVEAPVAFSKSMRSGLMSREKSNGFKSMKKGMTSALGSVRNLATGVVMGGKSVGREEGEIFDIDYAPNAEEKIHISETEPPSRRLLLRMIDVQRLLKQVNTTLLAGSSVPREEWDLIREATIELGGVFEDDVEFDWDVPGAPAQDSTGGSKSTGTPRRRRSSSTSAHSPARQGRLIVEKWK